MFRKTNHLPLLTLAFCLLGLCATVSAQQEPTTPNEPTDPVTWFNLGITEKQAGNHSRALVAFQRASELKPDWAEAHLQLGLTYENLGDHEKYLASIKEANRLKPDDLTILNALGHALRENQKFGDAVSPLKRVAAARPDDV